MPGVRRSQMSKRESARDSSQLSVVYADHQGRVAFVVATGPLHHIEIGSAFVDARGE